MIRISNLSKIYKMPGGDVAALRGINLQVKKGEFLAIIGSSGSGKSTLMNILGCLDKPTGGSYFFNGSDVFLKNRRELAALRNREIGFIFQGFNLLDKMTAVENVELPMIYAHIPPKERRALATDALARVGLSARMNHFPGELSGGQQQRVAIARAITRQPSVILADEPTGNLDRPTSDEILKIITELNTAGATVVLITHDTKVADRAQRVIEISDGKIKEN